MKWKVETGTLDRLRFALRGGEHSAIEQVGGEKWSLFVAVGVGWFEISCWEEKHEA